MIRLMFVDKSRPLAHRGVRFPDAEASECETDDEGRISVDLEPGDHRVEVETSEGWVERAFTLEGDSGLVVIDLRDSRVNMRQTRQYFDTGDDRDLGDRYEFLGELGRGGMGVVVRARDTLLNRDVAVKILTPELQGNSEAERIFLTEARSMAKLSHANLVAVHDVISEDGHSMMVVEFITGQNLEEVIDEKGSLSQTAVINVGIQVCRVIDYLHSEGVIHRDLKPANLMIEGDGTVKLIDFGLARSLEQIANRGTKIRGTPAYMAPEQVLGDELSASTDIYQIGVTLFEALTGGLPFVKGDVAYQHVHEEPPRTEAAGNDIFPALAELVDSCLAKDPSERPESARVLMEELQAVKQILTSGHVSAVQLSDSGIMEDATGQPASTPQPSQIAQTTGAAAGEGSLLEVSAGASLDGLTDSDEARAPAAAGPSRWLWPALAAFLVVAVVAFLFAQQWMGGAAGESASGDEANTEASAVTPEDESEPELAAPEVEDTILAARAVSSAGQVVQSANAAARTVVDVVPADQESATSGTGTAPRRDRRSARPSEPPSEQQEPDQAEANVAEANGNAAEPAASDEKSGVSDTKAGAAFQPRGAEATDTPAESQPAAAESAKTIEQVEKSEAESPASASSDTETQPVAKDDAKAETSTGSAEASQPDEEQDDEKQQPDNKEREERSAPVSF